MPETIEFPSHDGRTTIHGLLWRTDGSESPRGIVQLVHGMCEHIGRYDEFARALAEAGYVVCGHDHIGHGESVSSTDDWGNMPLEGGADVLIADMHELRQMIQPCYPQGTPYFVFGHSMGSFVVRNYVAQHGEGLAGAIVCGTGHVPAATAKAGRALARRLGKQRGERHKSALLQDMTVGAYSKAIPGAKTPLDWLSANTDNIERYIADDACGFTFTCGGNVALMELLVRLADGSWAKRAPRELPLLFVAGAQDPVGDMGKGVVTAHGHAVLACMPNTRCRLYEGMRHEILNEDAREQVYADIITWLNSYAQ